VQRLFYSHQKVVGQDAEEYGSPHPVFQLVEDGCPDKGLFMSEKAASAMVKRE